MSRSGECGHEKRCTSTFLRTVRAACHSSVPGCLQRRSTSLGRTTRCRPGGGSPHWHEPKVGKLFHKGQSDVRYRPACPAGAISARGHRARTAPPEDSEPRATLPSPLVGPPEREQRTPSPASVTHLVSSRDEHATGPFPHAPGSLRAGGHAPWGV